ncbi:MAG: recombinase family protein [Ruminococcaceae bacterium]|nr:recombinase family protein [Oscillospiraceae bacterium]
MDEERKAINSPAIYARKSKATEKGDSIGNQIEVCKKYLFLYYPELTESDITIFEDEGYSGGNTSRPQFQEMMKGVRERKFDAIVCYKLDRLTRSVSDFTVLSNELEKYGVAFISTSEKFDTTTSTARFMLTIIAAFAQMERETIAERIRDNMIGLAKTGRWLGGNTPTGYKSTATTRIAYDGKPRMAHKLEIIQEEADLIRLIFKLFLEYGSLTKVETYLLQNYIKTKNNKPFTRFAIKAILQNPVYMVADDTAWQYFESMEIDVYSPRSEFDGTHGVMAYNKTIQSTGKSHVSRKVEEWIIAIGDHEGIISSQDWISVANRLAQNSSKAYRRVRSHEALLSGILICKNCGSFMRPKKTKRINADGEYIYSYLCETKEKSRMHNCSMKNPNGNRLDKMVCDAIQQMIGDQESFIRTLKRERAKIVTAEDIHVHEIEQVKKGIAEINREIKNLIDSLAASGPAAAQYISEQIESLHSRKEKLEERLAELQRTADSKIVSVEQFDLMCERLFRVPFEEMTIEQKREIIKQLVKAVIWDGDNAVIVLFADDSNEQVDLSFIDDNDDDNGGNEGGNNSGDSEPQGGDCKRMSDVSTRRKKDLSGHLHKRAH